MNRQLLIAHAKGEEGIAEQLSIPLREAGYDVVHIGTLFIGDSIMESYSSLLTNGSPVILCGTSRAIGSRWARQIINFARSLTGMKVFALQMDEDAFMDQLVLDEKYVSYYKDPDNAIKELRISLQKYYPIESVMDSNQVFKNAKSRYFSEIRKRYQRLDLDNLTPIQKIEYLEVQLQSIYVEQNVRKNPPPVDFPKDVIDRLQNNSGLELVDLPEDLALEDVRRVSDVYYKQQVEPVLSVLTHSDNQFSLILGDPGSGKSTLTRYIILSLIDPIQDSKISNSYSDYLPILIELKSYISLLRDHVDYKNFLDYLDYVKTTEGYYLEKEILHDYLKKAGNAIVIFDGLDEVFDPKEQERVCRHIDNFKVTYPNVRIIVTSRILGFKRKILTEAGFKIFTIQDFDNQQIKDFVEKWYTIALFNKPEQIDERSQVILSAIRESISIKQLAGNPLLLTIMAILAKNQELPKERWKLYDHASKVLIEIWEVKKYLGSGTRYKIEYIDEDDKKEMLQRIAHKMQIGLGIAAGNYITEKELQKEFEEFLIERFQIPRSDANVGSNYMISQLKDRNFILSLYGSKLYGFVHRAFLEYFCALHFIHEFNDTRSLNFEQLKTQIFGDYWKNQSWHEILRLVAGMLDARFVGEIIDYLSNEVNNSENAEISRSQPAAPWNLSLAIKCLAEVKRLHLIPSAAIRLLTSICMAFDKDMAQRPNLFLFFKNDILPIARLIGTAWPEKEVLATILEMRQGLPYAYIYDHLFGSFIGHIGKGSQKIHQVVLQYSAHENANIRVSAPFALATGWHDDPQTYTILCGLADNDPHRTVCYAAIYALAEHFNHRRETLNLLMRNAEFSQHEFGRAAAITGIADHYHKDPGIFAFLQKRSLNETGKFPRTVATKALGQYFHDRPETFDLLYNAAKHDISPGVEDREYEEPYYVRDAALDAIYKYWPTHRDTLDLLVNRAENDPTPWLRRKAEFFKSTLISI